MHWYAFRRFICVAYIFKPYPALVTVAARRRLEAKLRGGERIAEVIPFGATSGSVRCATAVCPRVYSFTV